ncbi:MAG: aldehyde dehydrogenase (NADP(+)) [Boseongicola sp. SB0662_bin_57]|nr:aldehyde dehydrogenase (NADP(+)) [Boseongicola sp. SB0662_bin_57]
MLNGKHLIAGQWHLGEATFRNHPIQGAATDFAVGTPALVDKAAAAAEEAFWHYGTAASGERADFLKAIADEIDARGDVIKDIGSAETGLPEERIEGERGRTTGQLRLFADHVRNGAHLDRRHDPALPDRRPAPRPDLRVAQRPLGPVAVFGASNFPLAFSTAGGDTAAALAAGCPVVVKGHEAHPGTCEIVAQAIEAAIKAFGLHPGVFSLVQGGSHDVGRALVQHPLIRAVGFTGSLAGGRALFDLCMRRPEPIPFFGELGSVNPVFLLPRALKARGEDIAAGWAACLSLGAGQFCTNPGLVVGVAGPDLDRFAAAAKSVLGKVTPQTMLSDDVAAAYRSGRDRVAAADGVRTELTSSGRGRAVAPDVLQASGTAWLANAVLGEEVFGPLGLIVHAADMDEMARIAGHLDGQLTCTIQADDGDLDDAGRLMPILERKAGRLLANGFPTGVEVCDAMVHGGPYPASTNFGATSVGTLSIRRFLRPVCYQDMPAALLPGDLRSETAP